MAVLNSNQMDVSIILYIIGFIILEYRCPKFQWGMNASKAKGIPQKLQRCDPRSCLIYSYFSFWNNVRQFAAYFKLGPSVLSAESLFWELRALECLWFRFESEIDERNSRMTTAITWSVHLVLGIWEVRSVFEACITHAKKTSSELLFCRWIRAVSTIRFHMSRTSNITTLHPNR